MKIRFLLSASLVTLAFSAAASGQTAPSEADVYIAAA